MKVFIAGCLDGCSLWAQWDGEVEGRGTKDEGSAWRARWRVREAGADWGDWQLIAQVLTRNWLTLPLHRPGWEAQLAVGEIMLKLGAQYVPKYTLGAEVTFCRARCRFAIESRERELHLLAGTVFHAVVDGAPCSYRLLEELELAKGATCEVEMEAVAAEGWNQLDHPGHFTMHPKHGVTIVNVAPSREEIALTGRDFTVLTAQERGANNPLRVAWKRAHVA